VKDFRTLPMYKYTDKYILWVLEVVAAVNGGWKGAVGCKRRRSWLLPLIV